VTGVQTCALPIFENFFASFAHFAVNDFEKVWSQC
jgi:hypothetical protein